jgi:hypothetical protein
MPSAGLRFLFTPVATLPPLAWCAELHRGDPRIAVRHGLLVETRDGGFFEGVWDAAFDEFGFAGAVSTMGSGACHEGSHIRFVAPSHTYESLCSLAEGDCLWISNSPAFALASAGDGPDIRYPFYHRDLLALQRRGITGDEPASFPTACRRRLLLHAATDLLIDRELSILVRPRPGRPAPRDFASYRAQLAESIAALLHNATDPARTKRLRCAATISAGYDSPAIGVLAAEAGLRQAITFESPEGSADSGRAIAEALGMQVHGIPPGRWRDLPEGLDAEFLVSSSGWAMFPLASLAEAWSNSVIFLGTMGDELWRRDRRDVLDSLARPNEFQPCYAGLREYRLRAGIVFVHGPTISATNASAIRCITRADDMLPWSVGGKYDRPIPRRHRRDGRNPAPDVRPNDPYDHRYANAGDPAPPEALILRPVREANGKASTPTAALAASVPMACRTGADPHIADGCPACSWRRPAAQTAGAGPRGEGGHHPHHPPAMA